VSMQARCRRHARRRGRRVPRAQPVSSSGPGES
jgi:hypothetical protein